MPSAPGTLPAFLSRGLSSVAACSEICLWCFLSPSPVPHPQSSLLSTLHCSEPLRKSLRSSQSLLKLPCLVLGVVVDWGPPVAWEPCSLVDLSISLVTVSMPGSILCQLGGPQAGSDLPRRRGGIVGQLPRPRAEGAKCCVPGGARPRSSSGPGFRLRVSHWKCPRVPSDPGSSTLAIPGAA